MNRLQPDGGTPDLVGTDEGFDHVLASLAKGTGPFAIDTERAHGIRYSNRAYVIQIKREGGGLHLIDPLPFSDRMGELAEILQADTWILHSAEQDLPCLYMEGLKPTSLFDTEKAALILGDEAVSLQALVESELGIHLAKEHTLADWSERPLAPEVLAYAALDVDLLIELRLKLIDRLTQAGRITWLEQECDYIVNQGPKPDKPDPWRKIASSAKIRDERGLAIVREMWNVRDELARQADVAPGKIIATKAFVALASNIPDSKKHLSGHSVFRRRKQKEYVDPFWDAIKAGGKTKDLPPRRLPDHGIPDPRHWRKIKPEAATRWDELRPLVIARAEELGIRQDVLMKPAIQREGAWYGWSNLTEAVHVFHQAGARPWQIEELSVVLPHSL